MARWDRCVSNCGLANFHISVKHGCHLVVNRFKQNILTLEWVAYHFPSSRTQEQYAFRVVYFHIRSKQVNKRSLILMHFFFIVLNELLFSIIDFKWNLRSLFLNNNLLFRLNNPNNDLLWKDDEEIVNPILILSESIFEMRQNGIFGFSIPHIVPEIFRFLKYANEKRMTSFTHS